MDKIGSFGTSNIFRPWLGASGSDPSSQKFSHPVTGAWFLCYQAWFSTCIWCKMWFHHLRFIKWSRAIVYQWETGRYFAILGGTGCWIDDKTYQKVVKIELWWEPWRIEPQHHHFNSRSIETTKYILRYNTIQHIIGVKHHFRGFLSCELPLFLWQLSKLFPTRLRDAASLHLAFATVGGQYPLLEVIWAGGPGDKNPLVI